MPRKTIQELSGNPHSRFMKHRYTDNHHRKVVKNLFLRFTRRYTQMRYITRDWAIIRTPHMQPLIHKGRKHARG